MLPLLNEEASHAIHLSNQAPETATRSHRSVSFSKMWSLVRFNATIASRRRKMRQVFVPIFSNLLILMLIRNSLPPVKLPNSRFDTQLDPLGYCVPEKGTTVSFFCENGTIPESFCELAFSEFQLTLSSTNLDITRYADGVTYRNSLRESPHGFGANMASPTRLEVDVPPRLFSVLTAREVSGGKTCRSFSDPDCGPIRFVTTCAAAVETAAMVALKSISSLPKDVKEIATKFMVFPQHAALADGIVDSFLIWLIPLYLSGLFLNLFNFALIELVIEKEGNHMEYLVGWGISRVDHFRAWLLGNGRAGLFACFIITSGLCYGNVFSGNFAIPLFIGCVSYFSSLLMLAYGMSLHLTSAKSAASIASFTDILFNLTAISTGAIQNRIYSLFVAFIPTVPFFLLIRAVAFEQANMNPLFSTNSSLGLSLFISLASFFAVSSISSGKGFSHSTAHPLRDSECVVSLGGVLKTFFGKPVLRNFGLKISRGEIHTLVGGNGAGKTTLIQSLLGIIPLDSAEEFTVPDADQISCCLQQDAVWESLTVEDHINFFALDLAGCDISLVDSYIETLGLKSVLKQQCVTLSGGQKRRLSFLLALAKTSRPDTCLVILDEPTSGVDIEGRKIMWNFMKKLVHDDRKAVLLTTHYLDEAQELSDKVSFLAQGEVKACGSVIELQNSLQYGGYILKVQGAVPEELKELLPLAWEKRMVYPETQTLVLRLSEPSETGKIVIQAVRFLEQQSKLDFTLESVSLNDFFAENLLVGPFPDPPEIETARVIQNSKSSFKQAVLSMSRIRVMSTLSNFKSVFSTILFPILLISFSLFSRQFTLLPASQIPSQLHVSDSFTSGELTLSPSLFDPVHGSNFQVPLLGTWNKLPLPSEFEVLRPDSEDSSSMMDFLWEHPAEWFPFAIDAESDVIWLNPTSPQSAFPILAYMHDPAVTVTVKSFVDDSTLIGEATASLITLIVYAVLSLGTVSTQCSSQIFDEQTALVKRLAQVQGLSPLAYWTGSALGHFIVHFAVVLSAPIFVIFTLGKIITQVPFASILLAVSAAVTTFQLILLGYMYVQVFSSKQGMLKFSSLFSALLFESLVIAGISLRPAGIVNFSLALVAPPYNISAVMAELVATYFRSCSLITESCSFEEDGWSSSGGSLYPIFGGILQVVIFLALLVFAERRTDAHSFSTCSWAIDEDPPQAIPDKSVDDEKERILFGENNSSPCNDDVLFVKLWHAFPPDSNRKAGFVNGQYTLPPLVKWTVRDLTLGVKKNEVLGLVGKNGAGKTTALSILLGIIKKQTAGYAGIWPGKRVGFCPQVNALWDKLSAVEHVRFYAHIRGVWQGHRYAQTLLLSVGIGEQDIWKPTSTFSGGMKRRLCLGIALIGNPHVVILDEPTAGVDIGGKREIWAILKKLKDANCSVIITTHSLEEADSLCTRIAVMDAGRLVRVGTTAELKRAQNTLLVGFIACDPLQLKTLLQQALGLPESHVKVVDDGKIEVRMSSVSQLLEILSRFKEENIIKLFTIQHLSLQDVFLHVVGTE
jgi:ABC-type multidrug transport system ATPase subunit